MRNAAFLGQVPIAGLGQRIYSSDTPWIADNLCKIMDAWNKCSSPRECALYEQEWNRWYGRLSGIVWKEQEVIQWITDHCPELTKAFNQLRSTFLATEYTAREERRLRRPPPEEFPPVETPRVVPRPFEQPVYQEVEFPPVERAPVPTVSIRPRAETSMAPVSAEIYARAEECPIGWVREPSTGRCVPTAAATGYRPGFAFPGLFTGGGGFGGLFAGGGGGPVSVLGIRVSNAG